MNIFGSSGQAKVLIECLEALSIKIDTIFDDDVNKINILNYEIKGIYNPNVDIDIPLIIAIGNNKIRQNISKFIKHSFGTVVHPSAIISLRSSVGEGTVVFHNAVVQSSSTIGKHVIINTNASIDHDCIIHDFVHIAPNSTLCGGVIVGEGTLIGAGAIVLPMITIGKNCIVGAGSVVRFNMPDKSILTGSNRPRKQ